MLGLFSKAKKNPLTNSSNITPPVETIPTTNRVSEEIANANRLNGFDSFLKFMAALGHFNAANPHTILETMDDLSHLKSARENELDSLIVGPDRLKLIGYKKNGTPEKKRSTEHVNLETVCVTGSNSISLKEWLRLKFSPIAWENDGRYRRIVPYILAILMENDPEKVAIVSEFIRSITPYTMQTRKQNNKGFLKVSKSYVAEVDDFTITHWTRIWCLANENKISLDDETKSDIQTKLLILGGTEFDNAVPNTDNFLATTAASITCHETTENGIQNSENHILMINSSKYIKNQLTGPNINPGSPLEIGLCQFLDNMYDKGLAEFNSTTYSGHTIDALLNLHDFAEEPVKSRATRVLDNIFTAYVTHSTSDGRNFRPFARLEKNGIDQHFSADDQVRAYISSMIGLDAHFYLTEGQAGCSEYALLGFTTNYRLPTAIYDLATNNNNPYLALTGQPYGNAEISYHGIYDTPDRGKKHYLISGGGLRDSENTLSNLATMTASTIFGGVFDKSASTYENTEIKELRKNAEVVTRNLVLIPEGASELKDCFYLGSPNAIRDRNEIKNNEDNNRLYGPGMDSKNKNNTGVYFDLMLGSYNVQIPEKYKELGIKSNLDADNDTAKAWTLYEIEPGLRVAIFDAIMPNRKNDGHEQVGMMLILPDCEPMPGCEPIDSQKLINTIANENNDPLTISKTVKFPTDCGSVMRDKRVNFHLSSSLDRYLITGCNSKKFPAENRILYEKETTEKKCVTHAPGWPAKTVIQRSPELRPDDPLGDHHAFYDFMQVTPQSLEEEEEKTSNLKMG